MNQRTLSIVVGAAVVMAGAILALRGARRPADDARTFHAASVADASVTAATSAIVVVQAPPVASSAPGLASAGAVLVTDALPGTRLPDGSPVPPLPEKSPRSVRFGVVLVVYDGAQSAPPNARSKREAFELAKKLAADAVTDFHAAVVRGDSGSIDDAGRMPRGVLEPAPEYVLFTTKPGSVSEPVDTPRGFWIVKRIE